MNAVDLLFPQPASATIHSGKLKRPRAIRLEGVAVPAWLRRKLDPRASQKGGATTARLELVTGAFPEIQEEARRAQAYRLQWNADGSIIIQSPGHAGLQFGLITLSQLLEAARAGATLTPVEISDIPAFGVRGIQADLAREFFPPLPYLKKLVDRCADLKLNTLWLYLENHFHAAGLEDLSVRGGLTPAAARAISAYGAERGVDVVPGTNVLSHMEGWFRLERYSDFSDGQQRSYPVLTDPRAWKLVSEYLSQMADAFPSKNFHAGLDELLFTGTNPKAAAAIEKLGKPKYYADFALQVIDLLKRKGKTVWMWDDMVLGKNIHRKEGFKDDYRQALDRFPRDVMMVHWYYWTNSDGMHGPIIERVRNSGRPVVVAPSTRWDLREGVANQTYMAQCGLDCRARGYVCTQWEAQCGISFEAGWPLLAMSAGFAWSGPMAADRDFLRRLSFAVTGEVNGALGRYLEILNGISDFLAVKNKINITTFGQVLIAQGPDQLWRQLTGLLTVADRTRFRAFLKQAGSHYRGIGLRDRGLKEALRFPMVLAEETLAIIDAFDSAWESYHRAALVQRRPRQAAQFRREIAATVASLQAITDSLARLRRRLRELEKTGHTPYDSYALGRWMDAIRQVGRLVQAVAKDVGGLPYFEKLLYLPDAYHISNLRHYQVQNAFFARHRNLPWLTRPAQR